VVRVNGYIIDGNTMLLNSNVPITIVGCGSLHDDEIRIVYKDNHIFEISFDSKCMSVVLAAEEIK
jgi:hypothetical protein